MSTNPRAAFAAAAAGLCGAPFRLHGRDAAIGLDCVGLVAVALDRCGRAVVAPEGYALRALSVAPLLGFAERNGFARCDTLAPSETGDLILLRLSAIQAHLAIVIVGGRFVHAHAGLGRVVIERPPLPGVPIARWRLTAKG
ncbi:MAG: NlpC/P60 family protein [Novosphingobium sp.]|nr:NlpC/P60 family protein [Novosphingobium sp.]